MRVARGERVVATGLGRGQRGEHRLHRPQVLDVRPQSGVLLEGAREVGRLVGGQLAIDEGRGLRLSVGLTPETTADHEGLLAAGAEGAPCSA